VIIWGCTYQTNLQPLVVLQKKVMRIITFSKFDEHSSPLLKELEIIKLNDLITFHIALFMMKIHNKLLPPVFNTFVTAVNQVHSYDIRSSAKQFYYLPKVRTNYGVFNIRFKGPKVWNSIQDNIKNLVLINQFKNNLQTELLSKY
jgi:hypothetical protein